MRSLKNIVVGFLVSFIGSLPLGYLNVVGFHLFQNLGREQLIMYLLGVALVEMLVIYVSLIFAHRLSLNKKLLNYIEVFSSIFMLILAGYFAYEASIQKAGPPDYIDTLDDYHPFTSGLMLSGLNFMQIPFWVGWSLYLINGNYIRSTGNFKYFFVFGAAIGTFGGMYCFVMLLNKVTEESTTYSPKIVAWAIPLIFFMMAIFAIYTYLRKRRK